MRSVDAWFRACEQAQRDADRRRIEEVNARDLRRRAYGLCGIICILVLVILFMPR